MNVIKIVLLFAEKISFFFSSFLSSQIRLLSAECWVLLPNGVFVAVNGKVGSENAYLAMNGLLWYGYADILTQPRLDWLKFAKHICTMFWDWKENMGISSLFFFGTLLYVQYCTCENMCMAGRVGSGLRCRVLYIYYSRIILFCSNKVKSWPTKFDHH